MIEENLNKVKWILVSGWVIFVYLSFLSLWRGKILWESVGETFFRIFLLLIFLLINIGLGKKILKWLKFKIEFFLESLLFSVGIGLAVFTFLLIGLGLAGLFNKWVAHLLLLGAFLFTYKEIEDVVSQIKIKFKGVVLSKISPLEIALFLILLIQIIFNLFGASVLPSGWDALSVHLAMPKEWGRLHRLVKVPYLRFGRGLPFNIGILYGMALLIKDAILAKLIHFSFGILTGIGIYALSRRYFSHRVGLLALVIFYTVPIISWQSTTAYVDLGFTFYAFLAVYALINWINSKREGWLFISAVMIGLSLGSKYTGFLWMGILGIGILINDLFFKKEKFIVLVKNFSLFTVLGGLIGSFWYLRSGQSIFRILYYILKGSMWKKAFAMTGTKAIIDLVGSSLTPYFSLPWNITMHSGRFADPGGIGLVFLAFLPLFILPRFRKNIMIRFVLLFSLLYLVLWGWCFPYKRGIIPVLPLLSIITSYAIVKILNFNGFFKGTICILLFLTFIFQIFYLAPEGLSKVYQRMLVFMGLTSQEEYIFRNESTSHVFKYINENLSPNSKIFIMNDPRTFYCNRPYIAILPASSGRSENILARFKRVGITNFLVNTSFKKRGIKGYTELLKEIGENHLRIIYQQYPFVVYTIVYDR